MDVRLVRWVMATMFVAGSIACNAAPSGGNTTRDAGQDGSRPTTRTCTIAECKDGVARRCNGGNPVNCTNLGGACATFGQNGNRYQWCSCPTEGARTCLDAINYTSCENGELMVRACPTGTMCDGAGMCVCNNAQDRSCPTACPSDPDCGSCAPNCTGKVCGDNGCGSPCGTCSTTQVCNSAGTACVGACTPNCDGKVCGDDGCGGSCGVCTDASKMCSAGSCVPRLTGLDPNCNDTCAWPNDGECDDGAAGAATSACASGTDCTDCGARTGVPDCVNATSCDGCFGIAGCGYCRSSATCMAGDETAPVSGSCIDWVGTAGECSGSCTPDCTGKECGSNGCGGSCGSCGSGETCASGDCVPSVDCSSIFTCGACASATGCGYCADNATCMRGTSDGPNIPFVCSGGWTTDATQCEGSSSEPCAIFDGACMLCTQQPGCGYCASLGACLTGDESGPSSTLCGSWTYEASQCVFEF